MSNVLTSAIDKLIIHTYIGMSQQFKLLLSARAIILTLLDLLCVCVCHCTTYNEKSKITREF